MKIYSANIIFARDYAAMARKLSIKLDKTVWQVNGKYYRDFNKNCNTMRYEWVRSLQYIVDWLREDE